MKPDLLEAIFDKRTLMTLKRLQAGAVNLCGQENNYNILIDISTARIVVTIFRPHADVHTRKG